MALQHIPPIQCLLTFEALARLRNAGRAADELCVTASAISHRIRQLESHLGYKLFGRSDFTLTADGAACLVNVLTGLLAFQQLSSRRGVKSSTRLRVAITPTFCRQFVMPRLELFRKAFPDIDLVLQVSIPLLDVKADEADLEVRFGTGGYKDIEHRLILEDEVTPARSPSYLNEFGPFDGFVGASEMSQVRLIRSPLEPWAAWFEATGASLAEPTVGAVQRHRSDPRRGCERLRRCAAAPEDGRHVARKRPTGPAVVPSGAVRRIGIKFAGKLARWAAGTAPRSPNGCS